MWCSLKGLLTKLAAKVGSGVIVSVRHRQMSTVMSFGPGWHGALGLPTVGMGIEAIAYEPTPIPSLPSDIVSVHAGRYHSLALTSQGQLWAWGCNEDAQLGRGLSDKESWNKPKRVEGLENVKVCTASASGFVSAVIGDDGSVWVWGKSKHGQLGLGEHITEATVPSRVEALSGENIVKVSFGYEHALAMTVDGKLFRWGYSSEEAIGKLPIIWEPCLVKELCGVEVVDIACGAAHSLILCPGPYHSLAICQLDASNGANPGTRKIASWGWDRHYELGRSTGSDRLPGLIDGLDGENPISVSVGLAHSLAVTSKGKLWVWGSGSSGKLGFASPRKQLVPYYLDSLEGFQVLQAVIGFEHNLVLVAG